jgi:drug/metabolite transporter (DMT)-like permease
LPTSALLLALASALVHAGWNLLLARSGDSRTAAAAQILVAMAVWAIPCLVAARIESEALPYLAGAAVFQLGYFALLAAAYDTGELSLVYPLARGGAPLIVALVGAAGAGGSFGAWQAVGIVAIALGVIGVRGVRGPWRGRDTVLALCTAACIAGYTVLDRYGVRHASPLTYVWLELLPTCVIYTAWVLHTRGAARLRAAFDRSAVIAGIGGIGAYVLVLAALRLSSAAPVAAVRETSVVLVVVLGAVVLGERVSRSRYVGGAIVALGTALVALG